MEIQQAYETLSDIKTKRATINSKQQNANQDEQQTNHEELWSISTIFLEISGSRIQQILNTNFVLIFSKILNFSKHHFT